MSSNSWHQILALHSVRLHNAINKEKDAGGEERSVQVSNTFKLGGEGGGGQAGDWGAKINGMLLD